MYMAGRGLVFLFCSMKMQISDVEDEVTKEIFLIGKKIY
jgi:hypothetical protein